MKQTKTHAELEILLMAELRKNPVCRGVDAIAFLAGIQARAVALLHPSDPLTAFPHGPQ